MIGTKIAAGMLPVALAAAFVGCLTNPSAPTAKSAAPKYVFLFIGDGMSLPQRMAADEYSRRIYGRQLEMNVMDEAAVTRTCSASSLVTDSAAAATAIACGVKTTNGFVGMDPASNAVYSCAVAAKKAGKKVGIMTTVPITHATPAGFYAHRPSRGDSEGIAEDLIVSGFDYFAGGGFAVKDYDSPSNLYLRAERAGYKLVDNRKGFDALKPGDGKAFYHWGNWMPDPYFVHRSNPEAVPLHDMVAKGIELLDGDDGFFMMAEGGQIDMQCHLNDPVGAIHETFEFNDAVKVALEFAKKHSDETLVIVTGDHETGGLALGYSATGYALHLDELAKSTRLGTNETERLEVSHRAGLGWSTRSHSALPVITTATGRGAENFRGFIENTDIARILKGFYE